MGKKNLLPGQKSPIVRSTTAKPMPGLSRTQLTAGFFGVGADGGITPSRGVPCAGGGRGLPFAGDDAE
ncbi:MAG: hypothetical protein F6K65_25555 [Moorea sp. SIO3C2]|nr:hypothetical protein [Moorena sp. SIO3C2]